MIRLAPGLSLPLEALTRRFGILAMPGAGKSNTARVMAEGFAKARLPFGVIDPEGSWWGIRSSFDGKGAGIPIVIFGGDHGDVPLESTGGILIADLIADRRVSCVIDLEQFSGREQTRFLTDFAERILRRNKRPYHLFMEEADRYVPQKPMHEQARMLGAWEKVVRGGRKKGLGCTIISHRSAVVNKDVIYMVDTLIAMRTTGPGDRRTVEDWMKRKGVALDLIDTLPELEDGEGWVWSPQWLKITKRVQINRQATFDSAATPDVMAKSAPAATLVDVDLNAVRVSMAETIEKANAEDPKRLQKEVASLRAEVVRLRSSPVNVPAPVKQTVLGPALAKKIERQIKEAQKLRSKLAETADGMRRVADQIALTGTNILSAAESLRAKTHVEKPNSVLSDYGAPRSYLGPLAGVTFASRSGPKPRDLLAQASPMSKAERKILTVLAQYPQGRTQTQVAVLAVYASSGGGFLNAIGALRTKDWIHGDKHHLQATSEGLGALGQWDPLPLPGRDLLEHWLRSANMGKAERMILSALVDVYPASLTKEELANRTGYAAGGGGFLNALGKLRTLELIMGRSVLTASQDLVL